jgi:hypothetical protein
MAKPRPIADIPRFLLPRLSWAASGAPLSSPPKKTLRLVAQNAALLQARPLTIARVNEANDGQNKQIQARRASTSQLERRPTQPIVAGNAPIRHNGVYVASRRLAKRAFSSTAVQRKDHHFDTLKFVQRLKGEGFSEDQAVAMMRVLNDVIEESIQNLTRTMVLKEEAERSTYTQKVDFAKLRSELSNADSTEAQLTRSSHDRLSSDLAKLNSRLRDEIGRTQASVRLDLNLEKGRIREEANTQEMRIKETEARIEQEVASLRERIETVKFSTVQWLM